MNLPEFRLYYDDDGKVLFYTCDKPEGNYITIDSDTYFQSRFDIKVISQEIVSVFDKQVISKLVPNGQGTSCYSEDVSIVYDGTNSKKWSVTINECS